MNKAFNTNALIRIRAKQESLSRMKWLAMQSCHITVGEPMPLNEHPLRDEVFAKIDSGELVFS